MKKSIIVMMSLLAGACAADEPGAIHHSETPVDVVVSEASVSTGLQTFPATLVARNEADLATRMAGTILDLPVDVGDPVREGQVLVRLDGSDIQARIAGAEANVELARRSFERVQNLERDGAASRQELDQAQASLTAAEAGLRDARAQAGYTELRAPFDGTVTRRLAQAGDLAAPGRPILRITGLSALKVEADLPAEMAGRVAPGDTLALVRPGAGERASFAVVERVSPALEAGSRRFRVEAALASSEADDFLPGAYVRVGVPSGEAPVQWIPSDALVVRGQLTGVYVVDSATGADEVRLHWVRTGERRGDGIELLAGPRPGARIVRRPDVGLFDGRAVSGTRVEAWSVAGAEAGPDAEVTTTLVEVAR
jgi:RND family efflux transporter MFP subunit